MRAREFAGARGIRVMSVECRLMCGGNGTQGIEIRSDGAPQRHLLCAQSRVRVSCRRNVAAECGEKQCGKA
jgi:hypothetical protein